MKELQLLGSSKVGSRGQVTIPKKARDEFSLKKGDIVLFIKEGEKLIIKKEI